jgi:serine/threonine protein kinase
LGRPFLTESINCAAYMSVSAIRQSDEDQADALQSASSPNCSNCTWAKTMDRFAAPNAAMTESQAWSPGHRIGNFELQAAVPASAGTGIVYRAWDFSLARAVAVKEYLPGALARRDRQGDVHPVDAGDAEAFAHGQRAFVAECQTLARCDHPSLARVLHLIEAHRTVYCVMPWYSGRPLLDVRPKMGHPVEEILVRSLLEDFLGALEIYHRLGGVHGGIGPSKVLLLDGDRGLLLGPGVAGYAGRGHLRTSMLPTDIAFAAVEQTAAANGRLQGPWTDFYGLAAIFRSWMTGVLPSRAELGRSEPLATTIGEHSKVRYSQDLLRALDAAMSIDIERRPQTAAQFRQWLVQAPMQPAAAPQDPPPPPLSPTAQGPSQQTPAAASEGADASEDEVDPATVEVIRRVIDSIPDARPHGPRRHEPDPVQFNGLGPSHLAAAGVAGTTVPASQDQRRWLRQWVGVGVLGAITAALAAAIWQALPRLDIGPEPNQALTHAPPVAQAPLAADAAEKLTSASDLMAVPGSAAASADSVTEPSVRGEASPPKSRAPAGSESSNDYATPTSPATPTPHLQTPRSAAKSNEPVPGSPRLLCGARTQFSLYRCMQQYCNLEVWKRHPQCVHLKATDNVE